MESYNSLPASSEASHYEYAFSHKGTSVTGHENPTALNTDDTPVKYDVIKDDLTGYEYPDNTDNTGGDNTNYLDLAENKETLKCKDDLAG